jgi:hypothetical protein
MLQKMMFFAVLPGGVTRAVSKKNILFKQIIPAKEKKTPLALFLYRQRNRFLIIPIPN